VRDAEFISLKTEAGWSEYMRRFFMKKLSKKIAEGKYPTELCLALEEIVVYVFDFYSKKSALIESPKNLAHQAAFLEVIGD
jgi:hypothetical protein